MTGKTERNNGDAAAGLARVIRLVRANFQALKAAGDALHADIGITASTRAVLEHLAEAGPMTVPDIAKAKNVTRQHVQQLADALVAGGHAEYLENPQHKRSQLVHPTAKGKEVFAVMQAREAELLGVLAREFSGEEVDRVASVLERLLDRLTGKAGQP